MKLRTIPISIQLNESANNDGKIPSEVEVMRTGKFFMNGEELNINSDMLRNMIKNFADKVRGIDLAIDYKHESEDIAAGWIKSLILKNGDTELWAEVDWTPRGQKVLADKEFRYLSADFHLNFQSNETNLKYGPTLFGAGLTNRPFIKEMEPVINLSETKGIVTMDEKDKQIADLKAQLEALQKNSSGPGAAPAGDAGAGNEMADMKKKLEEVLAENAALKKEKESAAAAQKLAEQKGQFDKLLGEGKAVEAQRESFMSGDLIKFSELACVKPNLNGVGNSAEAGGPADLTVGKQILKLAEEMVKSGKAKNQPEAVNKVLNENKDLKAKYYALK